MDHDIIRSSWTVPQLLLSDNLLPSLETHASSAEVPNTLSSTAPLTNVGHAIGKPQDITSTNARNIRRTSLMFSKTVLTTTITYLLMQIITYPENAESSTKATPCPVSFLYPPASRNFFTELCLLLLFPLLALLPSHSNPSATTLSITSQEETSILSRKLSDFASTNTSSKESQSTSGLSLRSLPRSEERRVGKECRP